MGQEEDEEEDEEEGEGECKEEECEEGIPELETDADPKASEL